MIRRAALLFLLLLAATLPAAAEDRDENAYRLRRVLRAAGVGVSPAIERRLNSLSDREIAELVAADDAVGFEDGPLRTIVAGTIVLVFLLVLLISLVK